MGNHSVGQAITRQVALLADRRKEGESAIALLDAICQPYANCDAEFDGEDQIDRPLGRLMVEAFAPHGAADLERYRAEEAASEDGESEAWWEEVHEKFTERYKFW